METALLQETAKTAFALLGLVGVGLLVLDGALLARKGYEKKRASQRNMFYKRAAIRFGIAFMVVAFYFTAFQTYRPKNELAKAPDYSQQQALTPAPEFKQAPTPKLDTFEERAQDFRDRANQKRKEME